MILHNDAVDAILTRRSIRSYQAKQISEDALETILTAGQYAPSGMNQQSAKAIVVQSKERMQQLVQLAKAAEQVDHNPFYDAPIEDGCNVLENMMLAAHAIGLGSCWIYAAKVLFSTEEGAAFQKELGLSETDQIVGSIAVGYPDGAAPQPKPRKESFFRIV